MHQLSDSEPCINWGKTSHLQVNYKKVICPRNTMPASWVFQVMMNTGSRPKIGHIPSIFLVNHIVLLPKDGLFTLGVYLLLINIPS